MGKIKFAFFFVLLASFFSIGNCWGQPNDNAVWQWSVKVDGRIDQHPDARAFLWIPPDCARLRGVVVAQNNMEEASILENPIFRRAMGNLGFAEIWISPSFDHLFRFTQGAGAIFDSLVAALAAKSGYEDLKFAPVVTLGHSAAASWPYYFAVFKPERTLAALSVSGQWPYFRSPIFAPDIWSDSQSMDYVPALETMGEYENGDSWATEGLKERAAHPLMPLSMLTCPAEGHFATTDKKVKYLALYIKKAAEYRLPVDFPSDGYPKLRKVDPKKTGWLVPRWTRNMPPTEVAAPVATYKGNPSQAFWFFDEQMALATVAYQSAYRNKLPQTLAYMQQGKEVPQRETHQQVNLHFQPQLDGIHFSLTAGFMDTVPGGSHFPSDWTQLDIGSAIGHSRNGMPVKISRICGPFEKIGPNQFAIQFGRGMNAADKEYQLWFIATHEGDQRFKPAILQAEMIVPVKNTEGKTQKISFPKIADQKVGVVSLELKGVSDARVPVHYFIREGPVKVMNNTLVFTKVPIRSKFPIKVTVVAWQYGSAVSPKLQTAASVAQSFMLYR